MSALRLRAAALLLAAGLLAGCGAADGPAPVAWDRVACARCRMLVGEPRFAAQLHTTSGEVLHFDDPGCLLLHRETAASEERAVWLHHLERDAWLRLEAAAFLPTRPTPMGYGLGVVDAGAPGAFDAAHALAHVRELEAVRAGGAASDAAARDTAEAGQGAAARGSRAP